MSTPFIYRYGSVKCDDGTVVALKYIESMKHFAGNEQDTMDKMKGNHCLYITTVSGKEYCISMERLMNYLNISAFTQEEVKKGLYSEWSKFIASY